MEYHIGLRYLDAVGYIRKRLQFEILRTTVISPRGDKGARKFTVNRGSTVSSFGYRVGQKSVYIRWAL